MIKVLKYVGFAASGVISYMLMTTLCNTTFDYILAFAMTLVLQASSFYFFDRSIKEKDRFKKTLSSTLAIMLFLISIISTVSFQFVIQNNAKNEMIVNSDAYILAQKQQERKEQLVISKANEIETHRQNLDQQLMTLNNSINEYRKLEKSQNQLYTTRIANLNKEKNQLRADFADIIQKTNEELVNLSDKANETIEISESVELSSTKGYLPLLETFAKWFDVDLSLLTLIFQSFIACIFELTAICLHIEDSSKIISSKVRIRAEKQTNLDDELSKKRLTKSSNEQAEFTEEQINDFIKAKKKYPNLGYKSIADKIGIAQGKCSKIQTYLVSIGKLVKHGNTYKVS